MSHIEIEQNKGFKACIISPYKHDIADFSSEAKLNEAVGLATAINLDIVHKEAIRLREVKPSTYIGKGALDRLRELILEEDIELAVFDTSLTPIQQRNLEKELKVKVIDRTALILEIFGERANTKEGKLQVELAHLTYQRSRLVRSWTHLERQRGGAGFLGGPGETQIELDRRIIDDKIVKIKKELEKVKQTRSLQRTARKKVPYPIVALVGYTNAGKSSLFNRLTKADVFAKDLLFATLDPTLRRIKLPRGQEIILSDTVGFISDLPHELVMSFRATLEEVLEADIIIHVRDISNIDNQTQKKDVLSVLHNLGLKDIEDSDTYVESLNKIDLLGEQEKIHALQTEERNKNIIATSASTGEGMEKLLNLVEDILNKNHKVIDIKISAENGKAISWLHANADVISSNLKNNTLFFKARIDAISLDKFNKLYLKS